MAPDCAFSIDWMEAEDTSQARRCSVDIGDRLLHIILCRRIKDRIDVFQYTVKRMNGYLTWSATGAQFVHHIPQ
jgi:hypothetical protein